MNSIPDVRLETLRTVLRELEPADASSLQALSADPDVTRFLVWPLKTAAEHEAFVSASIAARTRPPRTAYRLAVTGREDGLIRGFVRMSLVGFPAGEADLGYYLFPQYWGRGLATEAVRAMLEFGFERLGLTRIIAHCDVRNAASCHVLEKIGMRREMSVTMETGAGPRDAYLYAALRPDRDSRRA